MKPAAKNIAMEQTINRQSFTLSPLGRADVRGFHPRLAPEVGADRRGW
jgi:hypothetical protein